MAVELEKVQDPTDILDWTFDWTKELATNGGTIASATAATDVVGASVVNTTVATPKVTVRMQAPSVALGTLVGLTCQATLSTGERQSKTHHITIQDT